MRVAHCASRRAASPSLRKPDERGETGAPRSQSQPEVQDWKDPLERLTVYVNAAFFCLPDQVAAAAIIAPVIGLCAAMRLRENKSVKGRQLEDIQFAFHTVLDNGEVWPTQMFLFFFTDPIPALRECRTRISPR